MIDETQLDNLLRTELVLQTRHCRLLEAQKAALLACNRSRFMALQPEYAALVAQLKAQEEVRAALLRDEDGEPLTLSVLMEAMPEPKRAALAAQRDRLHSQLAKAQDLSRCNEKLIQNELRYMAFALELFVEAGRRADNNYGGRGRHGRRRLLDRRA